VNQFIQLTMMAVMTGLGKSIMLQSTSHNIVDDLRSSIVEESKAAADYQKRGEYARKTGDDRLADVYDHIGKEEEHHRMEFLEALKRVQESRSSHW